MKLKKLSSLIVAVTILVAPGIANADSSSKTVKGPKGQSLIVTQTVNIEPDSEIVVIGKNYNSKIGIYVTFCVIPKKGQRPEICGPYDITGQNSSAVWVSSNPPFYAALLVKPFSKNGSFKVKVKVKQMIDSYDCKVAKCAILTRADHTRSDNRTADLIVPITIK